MTKDLYRILGKYASRLSAPISDTHRPGEELSSRPPTARRSPQQVLGSESTGSKKVHCNSASGGTSEGTSLRDCSPSHSLGSARRYSGTHLSCNKTGREDRARSLGNRFCRHEDSEELSDVSSGATSEDSATSSLHGLRTGRKGDDSDWPTPMLTGLLEGHVTRLATPPDPRPASYLPTSNNVCDDVGVASVPRHHRPRPPPVPRPRTLEGNELIPHHVRVYSPSHHTPTYLHSRDSSLERSGRESSCERNAHRHHHRPHHRHHHSHSAPRDTAHICWCEEEQDYDSCDERHHYHRHSYHEGLHHAHLLNPHLSHGSHSHDRCHVGTNMNSRRSASPCYCQLGSPMNNINPITDSCGRAPLAIPYSGSKGVEERITQLEGDKDSLQLQVSVLSEQVEAQTEKIHDLESLLEQKRSLLLKTEEQLQKEVMTRSSLETQRLELLNEISNLKLRQAAFERENLDLRDKLRLSEIASVDTTRSQCVITSSGQSFSPPAASTPLHSFLNHESPEIRQHGILASSSPTPGSISTLSVIPTAASPNLGTIVPNNVERKYPMGNLNNCPKIGASKDALPPRTPPPNARRKIDQFGTVPRQQRDLLMGFGNSGSGHLGPAATTGRSQKGVMFGKGINAFVPFKGSGKRSTSAPNLAETEKHIIDNSTEDNYSPPQEIRIEPLRGTSTISPVSTLRSTSVGHKPTGIKKIFTKLRRSSSGHIENDLPESGDLKRGGLRATATARLGWTSQTGFFREPQLPFSSWTSKHVEEWLGNLGLSQYGAAAKCWMQSGTNHIAKATSHQIEKDLGVRHPIHRKKLQLAISCRISKDNILNKSCAKLDSAWVLRWLDDLGLPQYKDVFSEARVDGLVLNYLTYDDLAFLRISNLLHVTSLKRGIQVLREHNFDPTVLKRRSTPEEEKLPRSPRDVALWTNHRVMEWLKTVDLSEYAPNLRGSGVHGALMVYEIRFTSEFLASLLSISASKTLLRRHLSTHFKELVGKEVVQAKRELEVSPGYIPLNTSAKIKMPRKSQFSLKRRKTKSDLEFDDLVCPLDELPPKISNYDVSKESPVDDN